MTRTTTTRDGGAVAAGSAISSTSDSATLRSSAGLQAGAATPWHALTVSEVLKRQETDPERGLSRAEADRRLAAYGANRPAAARSEPWWQELLEELREPMILLLLAVAVGYLILGERRDALVVLAITLGILSIQLVSELRAKRAIAALRELASPKARVIRDGAVADLPPESLVPGDLVLLQPGERVGADLRLVASAGLRIDESAVTGESAPVTKRADEAADVSTELGDRTDMAYAGSLVVGGKGRGVVVATGAATEMGRIGRSIGEAREPRTPLQLEMGQLARTLGWVAIAVSVVVPLAAFALGGASLEEAILAGLTLAFATIPEELPILITVVLALGAFQLSRRRAYVKRLVAAETLGAVSVVATDKTGTLTRNEMAVEAAWLKGRRAGLERLAADPVGQRLLRAAILANDAEVVRRNARLTFAGDPTETALLAAAERAGLDVLRETRSLEAIEEWPFDERRRRMSVLYRSGSGAAVAMKGAVESVLGVAASGETVTGSVALDEAARERIRGEADLLAAEGMRVLAFADRQDEGAGRRSEEGVTFLGLAALLDPPRPEAKGAIAELRSAGIRVLVLTGDHPATAAAIAAQVGLDGAAPVPGRALEGASPARLDELLAGATVFARIAPEHKLRIVRALQDAGEVVAVTGDGVNDAPALKQAAIGIAMGRAGSDVAKEVADMVLGDDNFATIAVAVREGRRLYANLRKAVSFYLAAKLALVVASVVAVVTRAPLPFAPIQLILLELFMDLFASITFTAEPAGPDVMRVSPRGLHARFLDRELLRSIAAGALALGAAVSASYVAGWAGTSDHGVAQTMAFTTWMLGHVVLALVMRTGRAVRPRDLVSDRPYVAWAFSAILVAIAGQSVSAVAALLHTAPLDGRALALSVALGGLPLAALVVRRPGSLGHLPRLAARDT